MKKYLLIASLLIMAGCAATTTDQYQLMTDQANYKEYTFTHDETLDNGSKIILSDIQNNPAALTYQAVANKTDAGHYSKPDFSTTTYTINDKVYSLKSLNAEAETYAVYDGSNKLFERRMCWPAEQADGSPELLSINGKLAVRFFECDAATTESYTTNMYYDGEFINQTYNVTNASFVFTWNNELGFIADQGDNAYVYYKGRAISAAFDSVQTKNCCSVNELLPTVYENGVLAIFGQRDEESIIAEIKLQ